MIFAPCVFLMGVKKFVSPIGRVAAYVTCWVTSEEICLLGNVGKRHWVAHLWTVCKRKI